MLLFLYVVFFAYFSDSTIAWQPNNPQQTNVSVSVSSVWGVSSSPSVVNPMMPMQGGGGLTQGGAPQYDQSVQNVPMKFPNQGKICGKNVIIKGYCVVA